MCFQVLKPLLAWVTGRNVWKTLNSISKHHDSHQSCKFYHWWKKDRKVCGHTTKIHMFLEETLVASIHSRTFLRLPKQEWHYFHFRAMDWLFQNQTELEFRSVPCEVRPAG